MPSRGLFAGLGRRTCGRFAIRAYGLAISKSDLDVDSGHRISFLVMIERDLASRARKAAEGFPIVTITGPRQSGKSTLCRGVFPGRAYANLELPDSRRFAQEDPRAFLAGFPEGAILDEVQRCPQLLSYLQVMVDDDPAPGRWVLTGSQNLLLLESVSQSLAGRAAILHLLPLSRREMRRFDRYPESLDETLLTGGYPAIPDKGLSAPDWLGSYVASYIERDVRTITNVGDLMAFQRFVELCAGRTGQLLNLSALASDTGITQPTAKSWLSILETSFLVFRLRPFHANLRKRLVKMPKLYFHDTGLVCWLLGIRSVDQLRNHPLRGSVFETWVVSEIVKHRMNRGEHSGVFFLRDQHGTEVDVVVDRGDGLLAVEAKSGQTVTEDMLRMARRGRSLLGAAGAAKAFLVHGGDTHQPRQDITVLPWEALDQQQWTPDEEE